MLDEFLERNSPESKQKRREKRERRQKLNATPKVVAQRRNGARSRQVPAKVRDEVYVRDGGRCAYVGTNGKRCTERQGLHVDHIMPFARGGKAAASNLRLLCAQHNMLEAERSYGPDFMKRFRRRE